MFSSDVDQLSLMGGSTMTILRGIDTMHLSIPQLVLIVKRMLVLATVKVNLVEIRL